MNRASSYQTNARTDHGTTPERESLKTAEWRGDAHGHLRLLDQTRLPTECQYIECRTVEEVWEAIRSLRIRGAPAIGIAAAYGVVLGAQRLRDADRETYLRQLREVADYLRTSRPTAVNLFWAVERMVRVAEQEVRQSWSQGQADPSRHVTSRLLEEARTIQEEDRQLCEAIGRYGAELLGPAKGVLTHCNTGALATGGDGTALAAIVAAYRQGRPIHVYVDETRPLLQGARLTTWELREHGIPTTLICDSTAAQVMKEGRVQAVITGADRIAANGDTANKIGTYALAILAKAHGIPFYVAAPSSSFDLSLSSGAEIPIEERDPREITNGFGQPTAAEGVQAYNPAFDVTFAELITAIVTEKGIIQPVNQQTIAQVLGA